MKNQVLFEKFQNTFLVYQIPPVKKFQNFRSKSNFKSKISNDTSGKQSEFQTQTTTTPQSTQYRTGILLTSQKKIYNSQSPLRYDYLESIFLTKETSFEKLEKTYRFDDFEQILPVNIDWLRIKKLDWNDFPGEPEEDSPWNACTFWKIRYNYEIIMKYVSKSRVKKRFKLALNAQCILSRESWVKKKIPRLLQHETAHYLLGCLCALTFKKKSNNRLYSINYKEEVKDLFNEVLEEFIELERLYDDETKHSRNMSEQKRWNIYIIMQLRDFEEYFNSQKGWRLPKF